MQTVSTIGLDIAKSVFQVHGIDAEGNVVLRRQLKRRYVLAFFQKLPPCLVGIGLHVGRRHQANDMTKCLEFTRPIMCRRAGFDSLGVSGIVLMPLHSLAAQSFGVPHALALRVSPMRFPALAAPVHRLKLCPKLFERFLQSVDGLL
jgi:hypothetical protein